MNISVNQFPDLAPAQRKEVEFVMSALDVASYHPERRRHRRQPYRVRAVLHLFSQVEGTDPIEIFSRDVTRRSMGFITRTRLSLGYGGVVELPRPNGEIITIACTLLRCRQINGHWFEGAVHFNRPQAEFNFYD
ncbi:MAG: hypothetical protein IT448_00890 [Phycisphaerales bacterium]|nr:hypothetical protein [Phycisphaerales bacterium]